MTGLFGYIRFSRELGKFTRSLGRRAAGDGRWAMGEWGSENSETEEVCWKPNAAATAPSLHVDSQAFHRTEKLALAGDFSNFYAAPQRDLPRASGMHNTRDRNVRRI